MSQNKNLEQEPSSGGDDKVARQGLGMGMGWEISPPEDRTGWSQCPDCQVWYREDDRSACPNCGYLFGQESSPLPAPALDQASLRAARNLIEIAGNAENARIALNQVAPEYPPQ